MIFSNAAAPRSGCSCCLCCCKVMLQTRAWDLSTGVLLCSPAVALDVEVDGASTSGWTGTPFNVCYGESLQVSGFGETVHCGLTNVNFAEATLTVYCDGVAIYGARVGSYSGTLSYSGLTAGCPCETAGGKPCEILIEVVYVTGTATPCMLLAVSAGNVNENPSDPLGNCISTPNSSNAVCMMRWNIPDTSGGTSRNMRPSFGWNIEIGSAFAGATLVVTLDRYWVDPMAPVGYRVSEFAQMLKVPDTGGACSVAPGRVWSGAVVCGTLPKALATYRRQLDGGDCEIASCSIWP